MAEQEAPKMKATLGLTGVTVNAMALIAPGPSFGSRSLSKRTRRIHRRWRCGAVSSSRYASRMRPRCRTRNSRSCIRAPAAHICSPSRRSLTRPRVSICASRQVRNRMVLASLLLGLSRGDGGHDGRHDRIHRRNAGAGDHERGVPGPVFMALIAIIFSYAVRISHSAA